VRRVEETYEGERKEACEVRQNVRSGMVAHALQQRRQFRGNRQNVNAVCRRLVEKVVEKVYAPAAKSAMSR